jgi:hypothetical protein
MLREMARSGIEIVVEATAKVSPDHAFDVIVPIDLPLIMKGYGPIPAVVSTQDQTGGWDAVGQSRRVNLKDGSYASEQLNLFERGKRFAYRVGPFSGLTGRIVNHADGIWWFEPVAGGTRIRWSYTWVPQRFTYPFVWAFSKLWRPYAQQVLDVCVELCEREIAAAA